MTWKNSLLAVAIPTRCAIRRRAGRALLGTVLAALFTAPAWSQNTQVTLGGKITNAAGVPGIAVGLSLIHI